MDQCIYVIWTYAKHVLNKLKYIYCNLPSQETFNYYKIDYFWIYQKIKMNNIR